MRLSVPILLKIIFSKLKRTNSTQFQLLFSFQGKIPKLYTTFSFFLPSFLSLCLIYVDSAAQSLFPFLTPRKGNVQTYPLRTPISPSLIRIGNNLTQRSFIGIHMSWSTSTKTGQLEPWQVTPTENQKKPLCIGDPSWSTYRLQLPHNYLFPLLFPTFYSLSRGYHKFLYSQILPLFKIESIENDYLVLDIYY